MGSMCCVGVRDMVTLGTLIFEPKPEARLSPAKPGFRV